MRIQLDWSLHTPEERTDFATVYTQKNAKSLTPANLEKIGDYILWGRDSTGKNADDNGDIQLERSSKTWGTKASESLDALLEAPTFNEASLSPLTAPHYTIPKFSLDRAQTLKEAPTWLLSTFKELFREIDYAELLINFYELAHQKRQKPPRDELTDSFTDNELNRIKLKAENLSEYTYLKLRHLLVELRREQYTLRDSYCSQIHRETPEPPIELSTPEFESEIQVRPLGFSTNTPSLFVDDSNFDPAAFNEQQLQEFSNLYWTHKLPSPYIFDFTNLEHIYQLTLQWASLKDNSDLRLTFEFYRSLAKLTEAQEEILDLKLRGEKNQQIAGYINQKYSKSYTPNYISTIFRQKILMRMAEAATYHERRTAAVFFPEEFKRCNKCGRLLLRDERNFVRKARAKDGFTNTCKCCDKERRNLK